MDLFDIAAKITLNTSEYEKGLIDSEKKLLPLQTNFADRYCP